MADTDSLDAPTSARDVRMTMRRLVKERDHERRRVIYFEQALAALTALFPDAVRDGAWEGDH